MLKLEIELVPKNTWWSNVRKIVSRDTWDAIRKRTYREYNNRCGICNAEGVLHCHEMWDYDDKNYIQTLKGFIALCPMCHHVKHFGFAEVLAYKGKLNIENVINHFQTVNNCSRAEFTNHKENAFDVWGVRSHFLVKWQVNFANYINERDIVGK